MQSLTSAMLQSSNDHWVLVLEHVADQIAIVWGANQNSPDSTVEGSKHFLLADFACRKVCDSYN